MAKFIPVEPEKWAEMVKAQAEVARLKAEVEQSKRINTELLVLSERQASDIRRLTKAGDAMFINLVSYKDFIPDNGNIHSMIDASIKGWNPLYGQTTVYGNAAKQGGQP